MKVASKKSLFRLLALVLAVPFCWVGNVSLSLAEEGKQITGIAMVQDSGTLVINGRTIKLWGMDPLAPDQQCWQGEQAWSCGEQATMVLRHFLEERILVCYPKYEGAEGQNVVARCFRNKGHRQIDVSQFLIARGLATEHGETSGGMYFEDESAAQDEKRGIWSGRFQTAQDWRDGIQRFVGEGDDALFDSDEVSEVDEDDFWSLFFGLTEDDER